MEFFNCFSNGSSIVSGDDQTYITFQLTRPVVKNDKVEMLTEEQALITIPARYAKILGQALLDNAEAHSAALAKKASENPDE